MHGPEHHVLVGAALLIAYAGSGGKIDREQALREMWERGRSVPGGICGFWGCCGSAVSSGIFFELDYRNHPLQPQDMGTFQSDDVPGSDPNWKNGRPPVLQTFGISGHKGGSCFYRGTFGRQNANAGSDCLWIFRAKQRMPWYELPLFLKETKLKDTAPGPRRLPPASAGLGAVSICAKQRRRPRTRPAR